MAYIHLAGYRKRKTAAGLCIEGGCHEERGKTLRCEKHRAENAEQQKEKKKCQRLN